MVDLAVSDLWLDLMIWKGPFQLKWFYDGGNEPPTKDANSDWWDGQIYE